MTIFYALVIALGGGLGSVCRLLLAQWHGKLPWGILLANSLASFIVGGILAAVQNNSFSAAIVVTGICGGLSTFSSFSAQTVEYFKAKQVLRGVINIVLNFVVPVAASIAGLFLIYTLLK